MDEFIFLFSAIVVGIWWGKTAEEIDHTAGGEGANPDVTVYDPHEISLCFSIASTHVPDLRIWPEIAAFSIAT